MIVKTIKLSETEGILYKIANAMIKEFGVYRCIIDGEKVNIIN